MVRPATESFELWMKYDFATVQLGGFTAPGLPLARWIEFFQLRDHRFEASAIRFYVFDLLIFHGRNMLREPLLKRRDALTELLRLLCKRPSVIEPSQMVTGSRP